MSSILVSPLGADIETLYRSPISVRLDNVLNEDSDLFTIPGATHDEMLSEGFRKMLMVILQRIFTDIGSVAPNFLTTRQSGRSVWIEKFH